MKQGVVNGVQLDILDYEKYKFRYKILKEKETKQKIKMNKGSQNKQLNIKRNVKLKITLNENAKTGIIKDKIIELHYDFWE